MHLLYRSDYVHQTQPGRRRGGNDGQHGGCAAGGHRSSAGGCGNESPGDITGVHAAFRRRPQFQTHDPVHLVVFHLHQNLHLGMVHFQHEYSKLLQFL